MSYLSIESGDFKTRLILGDHTKITNPKQIPEDCTGILLENVNLRSLSSLEQGPEEALKELLLSFSQDKQYRGIIEEAQKRSLPIAKLEPFYSSPIGLNWREEPQVGFWELLQMGKNLATNSVIRKITTSLSINLGSYHFAQLLYISAAPLGIYPRTEKEHEFRELCAAARIHSLGQIQKESGVKHPNLAVLMGSFHVPLIPKLRLSHKELLRRITANPLLYILENQSELFDITTGQYDQGSARWITKTSQVLPRS